MTRAWPGPVAATRVLAAACALAASASASRADCRPVDAGMSYEMPSSDLVLACDGPTCGVLIGDVRVASIRLTKAPSLCTTTTKRTESDPPPRCAGAYRHAGFSLVQDVPDRPGMRSETVVDLFEPAATGGQAFRFDRACAPRYREKRGDVWQYVWFGRGATYAFQAFEEDDASPGTGNSKARTVPRPLLDAVAGLAARESSRVQPVQAVAPPSGAPLLAAPPRPYRPALDLPPGFDVQPPGPPPPAAQAAAPVAPVPPPASSPAPPKRDEAPTIRRF